MDELNARLDVLACAPSLLVASDFDGTLAPLVPDPARAEADREAVAALRALSDLPNTHVAIVSGRALADLAHRAEAGPGVHLVGSHGSEFEAGAVAAQLPLETRQLHGRLLASCEELARRVPGALVERKPAGLAFHYRNVDPQLAERVIAELRAGPVSWPGVFVREGKLVVELSVVETDKGSALARLRQRVAASAVLFLGDDATDEDAFATLSGPDVGIKVGDGDSTARYRVANSAEVARVLARVAERRAEWLAGAQAIPIQQHNLLSDQRTVALLDPRGRLVWLCLPRIDSGAVFAELLGGPQAGFFEVCPRDGQPALESQYVGDSFIVRTRWPGFSVTDYLDCGGGRPYQRAGRSDLLRVLEGRGRVTITFAPRLDFGRTSTRLRRRDDGLEVDGALDPVVLRAPGVQWEIHDAGPHQTAVAELELTGTPVELELRYGTASLAADRAPESVRRERTSVLWSRWSDSLTLPPVATELVRRSALVLKALCYGPTGAICAAGTTSLPESAGGARNWDYRFCWPRDAALAATALVRLGTTGPAMKLMDWLFGILEDYEPPAMLRPVYSVTGGHLGPEAEIPHLPGYLGSRPVRVGNAAAQQVQLDVFGPIAELVASLAAHGAALSSEHWRLLETMVTTISQRWPEPDHGIWEVRGARENYVHSKVMCWQTVDCAVRVASYLGRVRPEWEALRAAIASDVLARGWNAQLGSFCASYENAAPDAAALAVGLSGLLDVRDARFIATVQCVERHLRTGSTVYRYRYDDGLPGIEGGFNLCTTWLIEAYVRTGRVDEARQLFERYTELAGPTGLFAEEYEPHRRLALGNYPQAYSHLGLINNALLLATCC